MRDTLTATDAPCGIDDASSSPSILRLPPLAASVTVWRVVTGITPGRTGRVWVRFTVSPEAWVSAMVISPVPGVSAVSGIEISVFPPAGRLTVFGTPPSVGGSAPPVATASR